MQRIVVVSNRLPFTIVRDDAAWKFKESVGGLATGLSAYLNSLQHGASAEYLWVGWPGTTIAEEYKDEVRKLSFEKYHSLPIFLSEEDVENFYQGFCNKTIWPLFHYFPEHARYNPDYWLQYEKVNRISCETLVELLRPDDTVWIHDYHLMLLPKMLREKLPGASIGFFLHIPFPEYELFRLLPAKWRKNILEGLLGADIVGFHTYDYMQYFLRCVLRILGYDHNMGQLMVNDRLVKAGTFPMGIDFKKFYSAAASLENQNEVNALRQSFGECKVVLSIDRLDYSKGIINRLEGFDLMLEQHPKWRGKVVLVAIVAPSRIGLESYDLMKKRVEEHVGKINGKFGTLDWTPIRYQYKALPFQQLVPLYAASDIALLTPLRDGMNLIAKEYIASRNKQTGVLILSEMAGAAKELGEAVIINPNNHEEIAAAILEALQMSPEEQVRRNSIMQNRLKRYDIIKWANEFIDALPSIKQSHTVIYAKLLKAPIQENILKKYAYSSKRLFFLDYDGTLIPFARRPKDAKPSEDLLHLLQSLTSNPRNCVVLISGRKKDDLENWFGTTGMTLIAEHGAWIKEPGSDWKLIKPMSGTWKETLVPILERYADRLPGAFIEEKDFSLAWHYRTADPEQAELSARELMDGLVTFTANIDVQVLQGSKVIEVRNAGVNKGEAGKLMIERDNYDFILAVGDDWTDEDLFKAIPQEAFSIHVGLRRTQASYLLRNPQDVLSFLQQFVESEALVAV